MAESSNPRVAVGSNSASGSEEGPEHDAAVRDLIAELNACRQERRGLTDDEKNVKTLLKAKGFTPRVQAIARRAMKAKKEDPQELFDEAQRLISSDDCADERTELESIALAKKDISQREKAIKLKAMENGLELRTVPIVRTLGDMDSIERQEFIDAFINQTKALRYW